MQGRFFDLLRIKSGADLRQVAKCLEISGEMLKYYNNSNVLPSSAHLTRICHYLSLSEVETKLALGFIDQELLDIISDNFDKLAPILTANIADVPCRKIAPEMIFHSDYGRLYRGDCLSLMDTMEEESVDVVFADPPFNLNKLYPSMIDDDLKHHEYVRWTQEWLRKCADILKPGGSLFLWNLPKWNTYFSSYLNQILTFRHWISVDIKYSLPIAGRLYPSHYSLLYYCKGDKPRVFKPDRLQMPICPQCFSDLVDYGGYKDKMNPLGVSLTDVWYDIPPVRHAKYKKRVGANELSIKLLDRVIEMSSEEGDLIFDPFGGAGTTYAVAELKKRKWVGIEIGPCEGIMERMTSLEEERGHLEKHRSKLNTLMDEEYQAQRRRRGIWTPATLKKTIKDDDLLPL